MPDFDWHFTLLLITNGVMIGLMYTLIALGFVLVYKATDAINFAQGEFVMFAGFIAAAGLLLRWALVLDLRLARDCGHGGVWLRLQACRAPTAHRTSGDCRHHGNHRRCGGASRFGHARLRRRHAGDQHAGQ